jgi:PAS domain S-box-containing protein
MPSSKHNNAEHERLTEALQRFGGPVALLQKVLDTIPQSVFWKDTKSRYLGCNQLFAGQAGLDSPSQIVGLTDFDLPWDQEKAVFYRECDQRIMASGEAELGIIESQVNNDGEDTWLLTNKAPLFDKVGNVIGILGAYHDITTLKQAEASLQQSNEQLEQRVADRTSQLEAAHDQVELQLIEKEAALANLKEAQTQLVDSSRAAGMAEIASGVLHNIGNVLNSVNVASGVASTAVRDLDTTIIGKIADTLKEQQETKGDRWVEYEGLAHLPALLKNVHATFESSKAAVLEELKALAEHIKFIADIVESQQTYARASGLIEVVSVSQLFEFAVTLVAPHNLASRQIDIQQEFEPDIELEVDRQKVVQILSNLIKNGLEAHRASSGETPTIWLSSKQLGENMVQLSVRDNGVGMSEDTQAKLFSFGYTTKPNGNGFGAFTVVQTMQRPWEAT